MVALVRTWRAVGGRRRRSLAALALAAAAAACPGVASAEEAPSPGTPEAPAPVVVAVELEGMQRLPASDLAGKLATRASESPSRLPILGPVLFRIEHIGAEPTTYRLDPDAVSVDRQRIEAYYRDRGYYDTRVADAAVVPVRPGKVKVVFRIQEGRQVMVRRIAIPGIDEAPEAKAKAGRLPLREGQPFTVSAYDATQGALLRALRNTGWANAEVKQEAHVLPEEHAADVQYTVTAGPRLRFGPIFVAGSAAVSRERIRDQAALEIKQGDWFSEEKLASAQVRVFNLGVFGGVRVTRGTPDVQRGIIPIVVAVREAPFRTLRAGPGIGVQGGTRWDANGMVGWTNRNFVGDLRRLQLNLRAGYAWLLNPRKEGPVALGSADFFQPSAISSRIDASTRLEVEHGLEQAYDFWSERLRFGFPVRFTPRFTFVPSYNLEVYQLSSVTGSLTETTSTSTGTTTGVSSIVQTCQGSATHPVCMLSFVEERFTWDGRNNPVNTRHGLYVSLAVQEGFRLQGYGYQYLRFLPEVRTYFPLGERLVLAARARVGALVPIREQEAPPIVARFESGGPQVMRGYYTNRLSPMELQNGDWVAVGGNGLADGSVELRLDLGKTWGTAFFVDAGNVSSPSALPDAYESVLDPTLLHWAAGVGLRYRTPFGPIRLDVGVQIPSNFAPGVPFNQRSPSLPVENAGPVRDQAGNVVFVVPSEHREPWIALHISIGEAF